MGIGLGTAMLIGGGISGLTGFLGARKAAKGMGRLARAMAEQTRFARNVYNREMQRAQPFRDILDPRVKSFLEDPRLLTGSPLYDAYITPLSEGFNVARNQIMERLPRGGALLKALADTYTGEATSRANILGGLYDRYENIAQGIAAGKPELGTQASYIGIKGLSPLLNTYTQMYDAGTQQLGAAGYMLGRALYENYLKGTPAPSLPEVPDYVSMFRNQFGG